MRLASQHHRARNFCGGHHGNESEKHQTDVSFSSGETEIQADGTVPTVSGRAVTQLESIKQAFALLGFDHQTSYNNAVVRHTVLYSIAKIAQKIQLNEDGTWKSAD